MKSLSGLLLSFFTAAIVFSACTKKNEEGKMIPSNAMVVVQVNSKSMQEKLTWDDIKQSSWFKETYSDSSTKAWTKQLLDSPANSGIDFNGSLIFFVAKNPGTDGEMVLEGSIKDANSFSQFNKNLDPTATVKAEGDLNYLTLKDKVGVAWNNQKFVYAFDAGSIKSRFASMATADSTGNVAPLVGKSDALAAICKSLFSLKSDSTLAVNGKFTKLLQEPGDIHTWVNTEEIAKSSPTLGMVGMLKLETFFKDNISTYTINFANGQIDLSQKSYAGKDFSDFLQKYSGDGINMDMIKTIPSQNVFGVLALNFKPEGIKELIKLTGMDGMFNMYASQAGINLDDFVKANKGDLAVAVTDVSMNQSSYKAASAPSDSFVAMAHAKPNFNLLFSVAIGDKASFQKLVAAGKKIGGQMAGNDTSIAFGQNEKVFAISNHQHFLNDYLAGNTNNKFNFLDKLAGHPFGLFIDIHKILTAVNETKPEEGGQKMVMDESLKFWNNVIMSGGNFSDGAWTANTEVNLMDQNTNSLKQLNHYVDVIAKFELDQHTKEKSASAPTAEDSIMSPPPIDSVGHK